MTIVIDTNVLLRLVIEDDTGETEQAQDALASASRVVVPVVAICEAIWVLRSRYKVAREPLQAFVRRLLETDKLLMDRVAVEAGINMMERGGDFADGLIALDGRRLGGETFVSFDKKAVALLTASGLNCRLLRPHK